MHNNLKFKIIEFRGGIRIPFYGSKFELYGSWSQYRASIKENVIGKPKLQSGIGYDYFRGKETGIKKSSAQITHYYNAENLVGKQVIGVCNFPKKNIAGIVSEVLILGAIEKDGKVVLVHPSQKVENGLEIA